ncbi:hypothetical protein L1080_037485 [Rhodococcus sp. MSC1_016]|jgi:hypothetical protein|uniref:hypothetical protein n=1 Tax=Rhodococcus sp. MSC1_016 TaxID=2909266 RepID=UPI00202F60D1|nr:hypothetical protein [Rhodococcus sp. MSC1_016]
MPTKTASSAADWDKVEQLVKSNERELATMADHLALRQWATDNGLATKALFPKFKTVLLKRCDIDYGALREQAHEAEREQLSEAAAAAPTVELYAAGDDEAGTFAVCGPEGAVAWYGEFFDDDKTYTAGDQTSADLSAARKAVFLAGKTREELDVDAINLTLHVLNHEVGPHNLSLAATRVRVVVTVEIDNESPALEWCRENGYKNWREQNLNHLVAPDTAADESEVA